MDEIRAMPGGHEYCDQPPVIPTQLAGPISPYAGSSRLDLVSVMHSIVSENDGPGLTE